MIPREARRQPMVIRLELDDGRDVRAVRVAGPGATVGRGRDADVQLHSAAVQPRHARLRAVGDAVEVEGLDPRHGLEVRGRNVPRALLGAGESFTVGGVRITVVGVARSEPRRARRVLAPPRRAEPPSAPLRPAPTPQARPTAAHSALGFDELLYATLRRSPWYAVSLVLHAALFGVLMLVDLGLGAPPRRPDPVIVAGDGHHDDALDEHTTELDTDAPLEFERLEPDDVTEPVEFDPQRVEMDVEEEPSFRPEDLAPASPFGDLTESASPIGISEAGSLGAKLGTNFGKDGAGDANRSAADVLRGDAFSRHLLEGLRLRTNRTNVRVLGGDYDHAEGILKGLGLEYDVLLPAELDLAQPGREIRALFYNCTSQPLSTRALDHLEGFVAAGGYLFTTDWGIESVLDKRFGRYVRSRRERGQAVMTQDEVISFRARGDHALLRGLPRDGGPSRWWLENSSILIDVVDPAAVDVLIESDDLELRHGSRVVAVTFRHGRGRVVHVLGHFYQQEGNLRGAVAMQRLLLNFLYQSLRGG